MVANEFLQCRKVCEHVLKTIFGCTNLNSSSIDNSVEGTQILPEENIELYCNGVVRISLLSIRLEVEIIFK